MKQNNSKEYSIFRSQKSIKSTIFIFTASFVILVSSFQFNIFGVMPGGNIYNNTRDVFSEALVLARISRTHEDGYFSNSGLLGKYGEFDQHWIERQYNIYLGEDILKSQFPFIEYTSNAGLQGYVYGLIDSAMVAINFKSGYKKLFSHKLINSSLLSLVLSLFVVFSFNYLGLGAAIASIIFMAISHWLIGFSVNLYWVIFLAFLPFIITTLFLMKYPKPNNKDINKLSAFLFFAILFKSLAGYEYMSTILIAMVTPFIFFMIKEEWKSYFFLKIASVTSISAVAGFIIALTLHTFQLSHQLGNIENAIAKITERIKVRTHGELDHIETSAFAQEKNNIIDIMSGYLNGHAFYLNGITIHFVIIIITMFISSIIGFFIVKSYFTHLNKLNNAILSTTWFSILAPLSWFVLAKGHSFVHTHLNHILWYIPFLLLVFAYIGFVCELLFRKVENELHSY